MSLHAEVAAQVSGVSLAAYAVTLRMVEEVQATLGPAELMLEWWPLLVALGVGLIAWGELRQRVQATEAKTAQMGGVLDRLARIETRLDILIEHKGADRD